MESQEKWNLFKRKRNVLSGFGVFIIVFVEIPDAWKHVESIKNWKLNNPDKNFQTYIQTIR